MNNVIYATKQVCELISIKDQDFDLVKDCKDVLNGTFAV